LNSNFTPIFSLSFYYLSMKTTYFGALASLIALIFLSACQTTSTALQVLKPAEFKISEDIKTIAVVDRAKPSSGVINVLEGMVSGELIGADREGRRRAVAGLIEGLTRTPRFQVKSTGVELEGSKSGNTMLAPLDWAYIEKVCRDYNVDAVVTIELFDSDQDMRRSTRTIKEKNKEGKEISRLAYDVSRRLSVQMGWRLYDPKTRIIVDEARTSRDKTDSGSGDTEAKATDNLPSPYRLIENLGYDAGLAYGARIAPTYVTIHRTFYDNVKGAASEDMKRAARYANAGTWTQAMSIWESLAKGNTDKKTAGRAALNMAVANEVLEKFEDAYQWAKKAYGDFGNSEAKSYMGEIQTRINDAQKVRYQMTKKKEGV
jgi:hypothetical protein